MQKSLTILVEKDYSSNNFSAYLPELRLSVVGDTEEEVINCATDLYAAEMEKVVLPKLHSFKLVSVDLAFSQKSNVTSSVAI
ncbi:type II toxin-antitoxin system HicB family antitoxin [Paenibacillus vini]|uniref:type II toxin-antitoxin system HicB family antitoxin n=1 Tax=Paenibacillus vini TaxID=1476024 RepID=UPI0025B67B29|nr:type II toxin-antitoxin system HicB family antitoxin [Paenibacillus vini]MDN4067626.1 type II toxin-antitoxin system HicB family antitoxin [Paenibacillus vini]